MTTATNQIVSIQIGRNDLGQIIDGLEVLADQWENTARCLRGDEYSMDELVREYSHSEEADAIAETYRRIISELYDQLRASSPPS